MISTVTILKKGLLVFFETLGTVFVTLFKILGKLFGVFLVFISIATIVSLIVGLFTVGSIGFIDTDGHIMEQFHMVNTLDIPVWLLSLLVLFAVGIPFFTLLILGLKILIKNLKSIGNTAKIALAAVWFTSIISLAIIGIKQATQEAYDGNSITEEVLPIQPEERITVQMQANNQYASTVYKRGSFRIRYNEDDKKVLYHTDIRLIVRSTKDSIGRILIEKKAEGKSILDAKKNAEAIDYNYTFENGVLKLDGYFLTNPIKKYQDQEIEIILYLPEGSILYADENTYSYHRSSDFYRDILKNGDEEKNLLIIKGDTKCLDCPEEIEVESNNTEINTTTERKGDSIITTTVLESATDPKVKDSIVNTTVLKKKNKTISNNKNWEDEVRDSQNQ